jgi:hypothetical protein
MLYSLFIINTNPYLIITRNGAIKLIIVKLFSVSQNAHWDTEKIEKKYC